MRGSQAAIDDEMSLAAPRDAAFTYAIASDEEVCGFHQTAHQHIAGGTHSEIVAHTIAHFDGADEVDVARRIIDTAFDFEFIEQVVEPLAPGMVLVEVNTLSIDAFIRTVLDEGSYHQSVKLGGTVTALGVGCVLESTVAQLVPGDHVFGPLGAQTFATLAATTLRKLDTSAVAPSAYLGALGMTTGLTAYFGIFDVGAVKPGDTVVVSGAAGAVGSVAGQLARIAGASTVIGIAGGPHKAAFLVDELGFDFAIDYKNEDVSTRLREVAPNGVNVMFDNVGGDILDAVLEQIAQGARIVICGAMSQYGQMQQVSGPRNYLKLAERREPCGDSHADRPSHAAIDRQDLTRDPT